MSEQRTEEWYQARLGKVTASRASDVLATVKSGEAAVRKNYKIQLLCERLTGKKEETFESDAMRWGIEQEPFARIAYEAQTGQIVQEVGFIVHNDLMAGCSPDGIVDDGQIEIKCPNTATHVETLMTGMPLKHIPQIQFQMWITGRPWCDFVSYDPRLPDNMSLYVERIPRDESYIQALEVAVRQFLAELAEIQSKLEGR